VVFFQPRCTVCSFPLSLGEFRRLGHQILRVDLPYPSAASPCFQVEGPNEFGKGRCPFLHWTSLNQNLLTVCSQSFVNQLARSPPGLGRCFNRNPFEPVLDVPFVGVVFAIRGFCFPCHCPSWLHCVPVE
jgi:hypothetical protein